MSILSLHDYDLTEEFLETLIPKEACKFKFKNLHISTRKKYCPQEHKRYEYIIGIAPFQHALDERNKYEDNSGSIPDAWICGENFNILFEFKIRGVLDESQLAAHQTLLGEGHKVLRLKWSDVINALKETNKNGDNIQSYLINQFLMVTRNFKSKRRSSGMPKQIISHVNKVDELYFIITGSRNIKPYVVEYVHNGKKEPLNNNLGGIQEARRWIANYVINNKKSLPITFDGMNTVITDYCVVPGRIKRKNQWNQWRLGAFIGNSEN
ncbi:hypothetical protein [Lentibacillus sp. Marseille-P4043]|uniref:hypothetical protein n=1 Tax=Lentibacillus sp. Marseille-P4043 TaxID=2040293 RepID=UPI001F47B363|nr:hypothetical protein [Lentibacillus sp. Marseille-P4043]